jgi:nucleoside-diphosphate-sugar epimerase
VFNIGTGAGTSVLALLDAVNRAARSQIRAQHAPARDGEWRHGALDSTRAATELGWTATTPTTEGIRHTFQQLKVQTPAPVGGVRPAWRTRPGFLGPTSETKHVGKLHSE